MPAPKKANTAAATAAVVRRGQETQARKLRAAGWTVIPPNGDPQAVATTPNRCSRCDGIGEITVGGHDDNFETLECIACGGTGLVDAS